MAKILVYNNDNNRMETYYRGEAEAMPYNTGRTLTVGEFRGSSKSPTLWTSKRAMQAWNTQRYIWGGPIPVGFAFKRPWEGGHSGQSQHYAGVAFDVAQTFTNARRTQLRNSAKNSGVWSYVEPVSLTPTWVHFDKRALSSACASGGFPQVKRGSVGMYTLIAQDDLNTLGYTTRWIRPEYLELEQKKQLEDIKQVVDLHLTGIVGCNTWRSLQENVVGTGRTSTTID